MKYIHLKCENCNADLNVDIDRGIGYCPYCGARVYADYSDSVLEEKEKTKRLNYRLRAETSKAKSKSVAKQVEANNSFLSSAITFLLYVIAFEILFIAFYLV